MIYRPSRDFDLSSNYHSTNILSLAGQSRQSLPRFIGGLNIGRNMKLAQVE